MMASRPTRAILPFAFVFLLGLVLPQKAAGQRTIAGVVTERDGTPINSAVIRFTSPKGAETTKASTVSRTDGTFELLGTDNSGLIVIHAPGFATKRVRWVSAAAPASLAVALERAGRLSVRLADERGAALDGVVMIHTANPGNPTATAAASHNGAIVLDELASGATTIVARAQGRAPAAVRLNVVPGGQHGVIALVLQPAGAVTGRVQDGAGMWIPGARVLASYDSTVPMGRVLSNFLSVGLESDERGRFRFREVVPNVQINLYAEYGGQRSEVASAVATVGQDTEVVLVIK